MEPGSHIIVCETPASITISLCYDFNFISSSSVQVPPSCDARLGIHNWPCQATTPLSRVGGCDWFCRIEPLNLEMHIFQFPIRSKAVDGYRFAPALLWPRPSLVFSRIIIRASVKRTAVALSILGVLSHKAALRNGLARHITGGRYALLIYLV